MKLFKQLSIKSIPNIKIIGDFDKEIIGINDDACVSEGELTWCPDESFLNRICKSSCAAVLIDEKMAAHQLASTMTLIVVKSPIDSFENIAREHISKINKTEIIGNGSLVEKSASIGKNVIIGKNCYIGRNVSIAEGTEIGDNVIIHENSVIGVDPFAFLRRTTNQTLRKRLAFGNVKIGDNVDIGANSTIARGITSTTSIGNGTKTDTHVHIGHDVKVGINCILSAYVGIAGYTSVGANCTFWARSGAIQRVKVADFTELLATSVITKDVICERTVLAGFPAKSKFEYWRSLSSNKK